MFYVAHPHFTVFSPWQGVNWEAVPGSESDQERGYLTKKGSRCNNVIVWEPLALLTLETSLCAELAFEEADLCLQEQVNAEAEMFLFALNFCQAQGPLELFSYKCSPFLLP